MLLSLPSGILYPYKIRSHLRQVCLRRRALGEPTGFHTSRKQWPIPICYRDSTSGTVDRCVEQRPETDSVGAESTARCQG
jgi:hypothetical protein